MLTPIEIQGITFKAGRGYKKEDVDSFMKALYHDYEIMYKENKELKDKVSTLSDGVQYYKNLEKTLQKALVLAEKTSEETKQAAKKQADVLEEEARIKAKQLLFEARQEYAKIEAKTQELMQNFELYKAQFRQIASTQLDLLDSESFVIHQKTFDFGLEEEVKEEEITPDFKQEENVDKVEVKAFEEEKIQKENLAKQIKEEESVSGVRKETEAELELESEQSKSDEPQVSQTKTESVSTSEMVKETERVDYKDDDFRVNLDGIIDDEEFNKSDSDKDDMAATVSKEFEEEERTQSSMAEPMDTQTDLEIKMLQRLLKEIKKNNEPKAKDDEFEYINTDSEE